MRKLLIRLLISLSILLFLFLKIDIKNLTILFRQFNILMYIYSILLMFLYQGMWALMWKITMSQKGYCLSFKNVYRSVLISHFFGLFIPSTIGPDIVLTFNIGKNIPEKGYVGGAFIFIRMINILSNLFVSGIVLYTLPLNKILNQILYITWALVIIGFASFIIAIRIKDLIPIRQLKSLFSIFSEFGKAPRSLARIFIIALLMSFVRVYIDYLISKSLSLNISYKWFLALIPTITIISSIPITFGGLGIREWTYMWIFLNAGLPETMSISVSLLVSSLLILISLFGGIFYVIYGSNIKLNLL